MANIIFKRPIYPFFSVLALVMNSNINAGGLSITGMSASGVGAANALTANTREVGAIPYNPSLGVFHSRPSVSAHFMDIQASIAVTPDQGSYTKSRGSDHIPIPGLTINVPFDDPVAFSLNVNAPFAMRTKWPVGTFPGAANFMGGLAQPTESRLEVIRTTPGLAIKLNEKSSIAFGIDHYTIRKMIFDAVGKQNKLDGDGWGLNVSLTHKITPKLTFGADYHSMGSLDARGKTTVAGSSNPLDARLHKTSLPWRLQLGLALEVAPRFMMEFDFARTGWSNYTVMEIESASPTTSTNYWQNADAFRLGMQYRLNDRLRLRAGYAYDQAVMPDDYFSARSPDNNRHHFGVGLGYDFAEDLTLDAGYMYVKMEDRDFSTTKYPIRPSTELNGTSAYDGLYEADAHIIGVTFTKKF